MADSVAVTPPSRPPDGTVRVPGSKYVANRLLVLAALADGPSRIAGAPDNEDIAAAVAGLRALGVRIDEGPGGLVVGGTPASWAAPGGAPVEVDVGESGTLLRFLTALAATLPFPVRLAGSGRIGERPMTGLLEALRRLGARIEGDRGIATSPVTLRGGRVPVEAGRSSQFASALLLASPRIPGGVELELQGRRVSESYLDLTASLMRRAGRPVERTPTGFRTKGGPVRAGARFVPADWTAAGSIFGAAAIAGGSVQVPGLDPDAVEGERRFPALLERMGCRVEARGDAVTVTGPNRLRGVRADLSTMPDAAPGLAALAAAASGETRISGIAHLRHKESDRIAALADGLRALGAGVETGEDSLAIRPGPLRRDVAIDSRRDHRIAMAFALVGLRVPVRILHPDAVRKSFPGFWDAVAALGAGVAFA